MGHAVQFPNCNKTGKGQASMRKGTTMYRPSKLALISTCMSAFLLAAALLLAAPTLAHADQGTKYVDSTMTITMQKSDAGTASGDTNNSNDKGASATNAKKTVATGDALPLAVAGTAVLVAGAAYCLLQSRRLSAAAQGTRAASGSRGSLAAPEGPSAAAKRVLAVILATALASSLCFGAFASKASAAEDGTDPDAGAAETGDELPDLDVECTANVVIDEEGNVISADLTLINDSDYIIDVSDIAAPEELADWEAAFDYFYWDEEGGSWDEDIYSWFEDDADYWGDDEYGYSDDLAELSAADATLASADEAAALSDDAALASDTKAEVKAGAKATGAWNGGKVPSNIVAQVKAGGSARLGFQTIIVMKHAVIFDANAPEGTTATLDGVNSRKTTTVQDGASLPSYRIPDDSAVTCSSKYYFFAGWGTSPTEDPLNGKKKDEVAAANTSMKGPQRYYALWLKGDSYWLNVANAANPETGILKNCYEVAEDMEVLHGTKAQTSAGKDKAAVTEEYTNYLNGKSADGTTDQEVRLYTKWNGSDAGDGANRWVEFRVIQVGEHDGDGSAVTFMATHSLPTAKQMNPSDSSGGSWANSLMRTDTMTNYVKAGLSGLCKDDESTGAKTINKVTTSGGYGSWTEGSTTRDQFWLLSHTEVFGTDGNTLIPGSFREEGTQYAWFANKGVNAKSGEDTSNSAVEKMNLTRAGGLPAGAHDYYAYWWLRSPYVDRSEFFGYVSAKGYPGNYYDSSSYGVVPAFSM